MAASTYPPPRNIYEDIFENGITCRFDGCYPGTASRGPRHERRCQVQAENRHVQMLRKMRAQVLRQACKVRGQEVCSQVHGQVRSEVRPQELMGESSRPPKASSRAAQVAAGSRLLETYAGLAQRGQHLFGSLLNGEPPRQWRHYPQDDAIDLHSGFQWFYHSHSPEDRPEAAEHGHIHLFAGRKLWSHRLRSARALEWEALAGGAKNPNTRHLLTMGFDAKGVPVSLFTVNSWVTGDLMLTAQTTVDLLDRIHLDTGYAEVDAVVESVVRLCKEEIRSLLERRDAALWNFAGDKVLANEALEMLSEQAVDIGAKLSSLML